MKVAVKPQGVIVELHMTAEELYQLTTGIGRTSINGLKEAGMSDEQAEVVNRLYNALREEQS